MHFNNASDPNLPSIEQSWAVEYINDPAKLRHNTDVLDKIAEYLTMYPDIGMQIHGQTGEVGEAPEALARKYMKRRREDVVELCEILARNRAEACVTALIKRGIRPNRLIATFSGRSGHLRTDFIPQPLAELEQKKATQKGRLDSQVASARAPPSISSCGRSPSASHLTSRPPPSRAGCSWRGMLMDWTRRPRSRTRSRSTPWRVC